MIEPIGSVVKINLGSICKITWCLVYISTQYILVANTIITTMVPSLII